jgi:hypothetical protein
VSFGTLTVIVLAGLGGPLLALSERRFVPIVVGEIIAGILVGPEALGIVDVLRRARQPARPPRTLEHPEMLVLAAALALLNIVIHLAAVLVTRRPLSAGLAASAQLGVPAAVASLGLAEHVLSGTVATAIVAAAVASLGVCTIGVERMLAHESQITSTATGLRAPS